MPSVLSLSLSSQSVVLGAAMAVSGAVLYLALFRQKSNFPSTQLSVETVNSTKSKKVLRSCLSSEEKRKKRKEKKRVKFADDVKEYYYEKFGTPSKKDEWKKKNKLLKKIEKGCRNNVQGMPANRVALYTGILRDRLRHVECSY